MAYASLRMFFLDAVLLVVPGQPMILKRPLMLNEDHNMVALQLVVHLFLNEACFFPNFKHRMSEELLFQKNEK